MNYFIYISHKMECCTLVRHNIVVSAGAMADTVVAFVLIVVCCFLTFFCAHQENEFFLGAANAISRLEITQVSNVGKHSFFVSKQVWKSCHVENIAEHKHFKYYLLVVCWETGISFVIVFAWKFSTIVQF